MPLWTCSKPTRALLTTYHAPHTSTSTSHSLPTPCSWQIGVDEGGVAKTLLDIAQVDSTPPVGADGEEQGQGSGNSSINTTPSTKRQLARDRQDLSGGEAGRVSRGVAEDLLDMSVSSPVTPPYPSRASPLATDGTPIGAGAGADARGRGASAADAIDLSTPITSPVTMVKVERVESEEDDDDDDDEDEEEEGEEVYDDEGFEEAEEEEAEEEGGGGAFGSRVSAWQKKLRSRVDKDKKGTTNTTSAALREGERAAAAAVAVPQARPAPAPAPAANGSASTSAAAAADTAKKHPHQTAPVSTRPQPQLTHSIPAPVPVPVPVPVPKSHASPKIAKKVELPTQAQKEARHATAAVHDAGEVPETSFSSAAMQSSSSRAVQVREFPFRNPHLLASL